MKISIDVECTPSEAREFFGVADMRGLQERLMQEMEERMRAGLAGMDPEVLLRMWMPLGGQHGWEAFQKKFWDQFGGGTKKSGSSGE